MIEDAAHPGFVPHNLPGPVKRLRGLSPRPPAVQPHGIPGDTVSWSQPDSVQWRLLQYSAHDCSNPWLRAPSLIHRRLRKSIYPVNNIIRPEIFSCTKLAEDGGYLIRIACRMLGAVLQTRLFCMLGDTSGALKAAGRRCAGTASRRSCVLLTQLTMGLSLTFNDVPIPLARTLEHANGSLHRNGF